MVGPLLPPAPSGRGRQPERPLLSQRTPWLSTPVDEVLVRLVGGVRRRRARRGRAAGCSRLLLGLVACSGRRRAQGTRARHLEQREETGADQHRCRSRSPADHELAASGRGSSLVIELKPLHTLVRHALRSRLCRQEVREMAADAAKHVPTVRGDATGVDPRPGRDIRAGSLSSCCATPSGRDGESRAARLAATSSSGARVR